MLLLSRKVGESIVIGNVTVVVTEIRKHRVLVAIDAPQDVHIRRGELPEFVRLQADQQEASEA